MCRRCISDVSYDVSYMYILHVSYIMYVSYMYIRCVITVYVSYMYIGCVTMMYPVCIVYVCWMCHTTCRKYISDASQ